MSVHLGHTVDFNLLRNKLTGELLWDYSSRLMYATDASEYQQDPIAIARPNSDNDVKVILEFAQLNKLSVVARGAGTRRMRERRGA